MAVLVVSSPAQAFCPTNGVKCGLGGVGTTHKDMTKEAIKELDAEFFETTRLTKSMKQAIEEIWTANAEVDEDQENGFKHFDGESFDEGKSRLVTLTAEIKIKLASKDAKGARSSLGQALHTLQDFYSHSTFIESGNSGALSSLWKQGQVLPSLAAEDAPTCQDCELITLPDGSFLIDCSRNVITSSLTSGYYGGERETPKISTKCRHGGPFDSGPGPFGGINKDTHFTTFSDHAHLHRAAAASALEATKQFIRDLKADLTLSELKLLFGVGPTLAMTIDTTGSMGSIIAQVRDQAISIVNSRIGTDQEPLLYVLVPFNDPGVGPPTVTDDPEAFKAALFSLFASGGGDCPELSMSGAMMALALSDEATDLFLFTDADAKDAGLSGNVSSLALSKDARIHVALFGSCSGFLKDPGQNARAEAPSPASRGTSALLAAVLDSAYRRVTSDTGGQVFRLALSEAGQITRLADATVRANAVNLLSVAEASGGSKTFSVPVDSTLSRVTFSMSGAPSLLITRPGGSVVAPTDPDVEFIPLMTGLVVTVRNPPSGTWSVASTPAGEYGLTVLGESPVDLDHFDFVETSGRPGHLGLFKLEGYPVTGGTTTAAVELSGNIASVQIDLRTKAGTPLSTLSLAPEAEGDPLELFGPVDLPTTPFVVYATGTLTNGERFQRVLTKTVQAQSVRVLAPPSRSLAPGRQTTYTFSLKNFGAANTFRVTASDDHRFVVSVSPATLTLASGETGSVQVTVNVPEGAKVNTTDTLTVNAESTAPEGARNFAVLENPVVAGCIEVRLGDHNLFLLEDYLQGHYVDGKVAAGGNIVLEDFAVGSELPASDIDQALVAGGNLSLSRGGVWGDAWYGGSLTTNTSVTFPRGKAAKGTPIDFAARGAELRALSSQLAELPANGTTKLEPWGGIMLRGTDPKLNVFQLNTSAFIGAKVLSITAPADSLVVVNIAGGSATLMGGGHLFSGGIDQHGILYNFVDATSISATSYNFFGTVLAPYAHVVFNNGSFEGGLYARSLTGNAAGHLNALHERDICK